MRLYTYNLVLFVNYCSSGVVWEMKPKQKWKPFSQKQILSLEQSYQKHLVSQDRGWIKLDSNFEVYQSVVFWLYSLWFYSFVGPLVLGNGTWSK